MLPHGVLFRGAAEGHIRRYLIEQKNCLDVVIGLPANIFYGTSIPTCILVLKKQRKEAGNILFIDASAHYGKATNQNNLREEDLDRILDAVANRKFIEKFSYVASVKKSKLNVDEETIEENDFNLNITRFVDTFEKEESIDLKLLSNSLSKLEESIKVSENELSGFISELGISSPHGEL